MSCEPPDDIARFQRDIDYNFVKFWELPRIIRNTSTSINSIHSALASLEDDEFREIVAYGVTTYFDKTNDFDVIVKLQDVFKQEEQAVFPTNGMGNKKITEISLKNNSNANDKNSTV